MKQLALDFASPPQPTLDNFVAGLNGELLGNLKRLAAGNARERCFFLWGRPGCGRSHLLRATVDALRSEGAAATYLACAAGTRIEAGLERKDRSRCSISTTRSASMAACCSRAPASRRRS
jgi:DnaA family protein